MNFHVRKRRQTPSVIIVALIDVLIVLLIFLMVTTTFKQQAAVRVNLPESSQAQKTGAQEQAPLVVSIDVQGNYRLGADARPVTPDQLKSELTSQAQTNPAVRIAISADKGAPFGQVVKVWDATKESGIKSVNIFMKEAAKQ